jgi:hypothetical protein
VQQSIRVGTNALNYCWFIVRSLALVRLEPGVDASIRSESSHRRGAA